MRKQLRAVAHMFGLEGEVIALLSSYGTPRFNYRSTNGARVPKRLARRLGLPSLFLIGVDCLAR